MTLITINTDQEPQCLKDLSMDSSKQYSDLKGQCKKEVINLLKSEQNNLCAYCQKSTESVVFIEHYIAQNDMLNNRSDLQLSYSNFLGVCSGRIYEKNKVVNTHCDSSKGNTTLRLNPKNEDHINTISYTDDAKIISSDDTFNTDLDDVLKLNLDSICKKRIKSFNDYFDLLIETEVSTPQASIYDIALRDLNSNPPEYYGYLKFRFELLLS